MPARFSKYDALISHFGSFVPSLGDPLLVQKYTGLTCVVSATAFEVCIKEILCNFAHKKHKVLGVFADEYFDKLNGRIKLQTLKQDYIAKFGEKYVNKFETRLDLLENQSLQRRGKSIKSSYGNVITWRHQFAHEGELPSNATFAEAMDGYGLGKELVLCLSNSMIR